MSDLRELLDGLAGEAPRYDVVPAVRARRQRRIRHRRIAGVGLLASAVIVAVGTQVPRAFGPPGDSPAAQPFPTVWNGCQAQRLPLPAGYDGVSAVGAMDPTGRYLGGGASRGQTSIAVIWDRGGQPRQVPVQGDSVGVADLDATGTALVSSVVDGENVGWIVRDGIAARLPGTDVAVLRFNATGQVLGRIGMRPMVWRDASRQPTPLPLPDGITQAAVYDIADDGTVVGTIHGTAGPRPYLWHPDGTGEELALPEQAAEPIQDVRVGAVYGDWITGAVRYGDSAGTTLLIRWNRATGRQSWWPARSMPDAYGDGIGAGADRFHDGRARLDPDTVHAGTDIELTAFGTGRTLPTAAGAVPPTNGPDAQFAAISRDGSVIGGSQEFPIAAGSEQTIPGAVWWRCD